MEAYPDIPFTWRGAARGALFRTIRSTVEIGYSRTRPAWQTATGILIFSLTHTVEVSDHDILEAFFNARKSADPVFNFTDPKTQNIIPCEYLTDLWPAKWVASNFFEIPLDIRQILG